MDSEHIRFDYSSAHYDDNGLGIDRQQITQMVFPETAASELQRAARGATSLDEYADADGSLTLTVSEIRLSEEDEDCLNVLVETPDFALTFPYNDSAHSRMVYRGEEYDHYQFGIKGTK